MATLPVVEGGQIMLRGAQGGVPMAQISPGQVEPIAARAAAQQAGTMAQILDRMSASAFQEAGRLAPLEAMQFVADNPITPEQIAIAKNGLPIARRGSGNIFDEAVAKARSFELASHFEQEGKNELVKMLADIKTNPDKVDAQQLSQKIASISNGYSKAIAPTDPEAALKFRATMATHGNTVLNAAYQEQAKFNQQKNLIKLTQDLDNVQQLLYAAAKYDPNNFDALADTHRENLLKQALTIGSAQEYEQTQNRIRTIIRQTKIDAISDELSMNDSYFENPRQTEREIRTGLVRSEQRFNPMLSNLIARDGQAVEEILKRFRAQYAARQNFIEAEYKDANQKADGILQQIYTSRDRAQATNLFNSLAELPVSPEKIKAARTWIDGDAIAGPQRDDLEQLGDLNQRISVGAATQQDIINAPGITRRTKEQMLSRFSNVTDDIGAATRSIERSVGIFSASLPPELPTPQARALAVKTRNENVGALYEFARTLGPDGKLPSPPQIRAHGDMLAEQSRKIINEAFVVIAPAAEQEARMMLQELSGVNLLDETAVAEAFKKAAKRGAQQATLNSARDAVNRFRDASAKSGATR